MPDVQGEMKSIVTSVPGLHICDRLPKLAKVMDKFTVVRSMTHPYPVHGLAYALTGIPAYTPELEARARDNRHWPFIGSVVDYLERNRSNPASEIPRNIGLPWLVSSKSDDPSINAGPFAAFLGDEYDPLWTDFDGAGLHIAPKNTVDQKKRYRNPFGGTTPDGRFHMSSASEAPTDVSIKRLRMRRSLLAQFDRDRRWLDRSPQVRAWDSQQQLAMSLLTSNKMRDALNIGLEPRASRERYGMNLRLAMAAKCLTIRFYQKTSRQRHTIYWGLTRIRQCRIGSVNRIPLRAAVSCAPSYSVSRC